MLYISPWHKFMSRIVIGYASDLYGRYVSPVFRHSLSARLVGSKGHVNVNFIRFHE